MEKMFYLNILYDYYKNLLTDKQRHYFEMYYSENLSLSEISELESVSRNAVFNQIKTVEKKLEEFEKSLKLYKKKSDVINLVKEYLPVDKVDELNNLL